MIEGQPQPGDCRGRNDRDYSGLVIEGQPQRDRVRLLCGNDYSGLVIEEATNQGLLALAGDVFSAIGLNESFLAQLLVGPPTHGISVPGRTLPNMVP